MSIKFRDFLPHEIIKPKSLLGVQYTQPTYETFEVAAMAASEWIETGEIQVLNMETIIFPSSGPINEENSAAFVPAGSGMGSFRQFLRVWYRA